MEQLEYKEFSTQQTHLMNFWHSADKLNGLFQGFYTVFVAEVDEGMRCGFAQILHSDSSAHLLQPFSETFVLVLPQSSECGVMILLTSDIR